VLRKIFVHKRDEIPGEWTKLHNEELRLIICTSHHMFFGDQIEKNEMGCACSTYGGREMHIKSFGGES
jgi:hypothetical protein